VPLDMPAPIRGTRELMGPISTGITQPSGDPVACSNTCEVLVMEFWMAARVSPSAASGEPMMASTQDAVAPS